MRNMSQTIAREGVSVLVIDDFNRLQRYECSALLNFTIAAIDLKYPPGNQIDLLGPEYLLVRHRMRLQRRMMKPQIGDVRRVLVAMGGVDSPNSTCEAANVLLRIGRDLSIHVIVGQDYMHHKDLSLPYGAFVRDRLRRSYSIWRTNLLGLICVFAGEA
jgi:spore coat polysaccharide biosynthesis predicted glycosyltransferase SpsG